jgi:hypothetical protein
MDSPSQEASESLFFIENGELFRLSCLFRDGSLSKTSKGSYFRCVLFSDGHPYKKLIKKGKAEQHISGLHPFWFTSTMNLSLKSSATACSALRTDKNRLHYLIKLTYT